MDIESGHGTKTRTARPAVAAALTLGIGMGGFLDGIVLHQILQVHNMLSGWLPVTDLVSAKANMVWDGLFHAGVWIVTLLGVVMLWRAGRRSDVAMDTPYLVGGLIAGWGLFNTVEGVTDHLILGVHHVYEQLGQSVWDYVFLAWGIAMIAGGWLIIRGAGRRRERVDY